MNVDPFVGRAAEIRAWRSILAASRDADDDSAGSFVVLVHGIGGMGKSRLVNRIVAELDDGARNRTRRRLAPTPVLIDLEDERRRVPDRYPPLEGPSMGTLLYAVERAVCEQLGKHAEQAFAGFRGELAGVIDLVRDADRLDSEARQAGRELTDRERSALKRAADLVGGLVGVPGAGQAAETGLSLGTAATRGLRRRGKKPPDSTASVPQRRIDRAFDAERVLVREFSAGLTHAAGKHGLVIAIDTGEIAARALGAVRDAAKLGASSVVWLLAGRFDTPVDVGYGESTVGDFERTIGGERLQVVAISVFDRRLQREYLSTRLPDAQLTDADIARIDRATRGIPLGLWLVVAMLRDGVPLTALDEVVDEHGDANLLVRGLAKRFLMHSLSLPSDRPNALRDDLPAIYALIADETGGSGRTIGFSMRRRIRAALLGIEVDELGARLDQLAARHDFVVAASGTVHEEVAAVIRDFMLGADQRHRCAAMHERALSVIADELAARYRDIPLGDRVRDEPWRVLAEAYVRHSFWISNERGISALFEVLPAARILLPSFGTALRALAARFYPTASSDEQAILRGMRWPTESSFLDLWLEHRRTGPAVSRATIPPPDDADVARTDRCRHRAQTDIPGLSPDQVSRDVISELLQADECDADEANQRVTHLAKAHRLLVHDDARLGAAIGSRARSAASPLVFPGGAAMSHDPDGLRAAEVAAGRLDGEAVVLGVYAVALRHAGQDDEADATYRRALDIDPTNAVNLGNYANFLDAVRGDADLAEQQYKRALEIDPTNANNIGNYAAFLKNVRGDADLAEQHYKRALETDPTNAFSLGSYAHFLDAVRGDADLADQHYKRALDANPNDADCLGNYAGLLLAGGRDMSARALIERAFENARSGRDPLRAELWFYLFALGDPDEYDRALSELAQLVAKGVRSPGWDFSRIVTRAVEQAHPHATWLPALADVVSDREGADALAEWPAWRG